MGPGYQKREEREKERITQEKTVPVTLKQGSTTDKIKLKPQKTFFPTDIFAAPETSFSPPDIYGVSGETKRTKQPQFDWIGEDLAKDLGMTSYRGPTTTKGRLQGVMSPWASIVAGAKAGWDFGQWSFGEGAFAVAGTSTGLGAAKRAPWGKKSEAFIEGYLEGGEAAAGGLVLINS